MKQGGISLFSVYPSLAAALRTFYPEYDWENSRFVEAGHTPPGHWQKDANLLAALERAEKQIGVQKVRG